MKQGPERFEGDYCFSLPAAGVPAHRYLKQEENMKSRTESPVKARSAAAPVKHARSARKTEASSGNYDCPREQMIAEAAYYRAERRGFASGNEMSDWLEAEADVEHVLRNSP
jgi:hypothetical protein